MDVRRFSTPRTVRLVRSSPPSARTRVIYVACHGYGMDVERFARWFADAPPSQVVFCPEGLSRFYWGDFDGPPVASWMTRAERLAEIDDFCAWLDQVYAYARQAAPQAKIVLLGFSQGAATVMRWANARRPPFDRLVLWSGTPPEDIDYAPREYWAPRKLMAFWGEADELVPWARAERRFREVGLPFAVSLTAGGHRVDAVAWRKLTRELSG